MYNLCSWWLRLFSGFCFWFFYHYQFKHINQFEATASLNVRKILYVIAGLTPFVKVMKNKRYKPVWTIKYLLPCIFSFLFFASNHIYLQSPLALKHLDITDIFIFLTGVCVLYFMIYSFTVEYEITERELIIYSFFWRAKEYDINSIQYIDEDSIYSFLSICPVGMGLLVLKLKNGKRLIIIGLSEQLKFVQEIRALQSSHF